MSADGAKSRTQGAGKQGQNKVRLGQRNLKTALMECRRSAKRTFKKADRVYTHVEAALGDFDKTLAKAARRYKSLDDDHDHELKQVTRQLVQERRQTIKSRFKELKLSHHRREKELSTFTVMLFGRTMAGKSTTMEALTGGSGKTIGKGAPDFTRNIKGMDWEGLTLVDTPGLLGFNEDVRGIAESYVDRADLICMVVTDDTIEPSLFQQMRNVRGQNKRLIVLLNWKAANQPILDDEPEDAWDDEEVGQQIAVIRNHLDETFRGEEVPIVPFCANLAFEAHREENDERRDYLWKESRIDVVADTIADVVTQDGLAIRATAPLDGLTYFTQATLDELEPDLAALRPQHRELMRKQHEAARRFARIRMESASELSGLKSHFLRVNSNLHDLAWEYARGERKESVSAALKREMKWGNVESWTKEYRNSTTERVQRNLQQFQDTLGTDLVATVRSDSGFDFEGIEVDSNSLRAASLWETGGKLGKYAGIAAVGIAGLLTGGLGGLAIALIGAPVMTWVGNSATERGRTDRRRQQVDLRESMKDQLWDNYRKLNDELYAWMQETAESAETSIMKMLSGLADATFVVLEEGSQLVQSLQDQRHKLSVQSYSEVLRILHPAFSSGRVRLVNASQWMGFRAKILVEGRGGCSVAGLVIGKGGASIRRVQSHTGNPIDVVEMPSQGVSKQSVVDALKPARLSPSQVQLTDRALVTVDTRQAGAVNGFRRRNRLLAQDVLGIQIDIRRTHYKSGKGAVVHTPPPSVRKRP